MRELKEVSGATERPGGCRIRLSQSDNGVTTILIPRRETSLILNVAVGLLLVNLLALVYVGVMLITLNKSVLWMTQVSPHGLPVSLVPFTAWIGLVWLAFSCLCFWLLFTLVRPILIWERLSLGPDEIVHERHLLRRTEQRILRRPDVRGFVLRRDPQGLVASELTLQGRGEAISIAEAVREADREWLASVGNALLRHG